MLFSIPPLECMQRRVTIVQEHPRRLFFQKALDDWHSQVDERFLRCSLHKARVNLKHYPLEVENVHQLRQVQGIGVAIAVQLDQAWSNFVAKFPTPPRTRDVRALKRGDCLALLDLKTNTASGPASCATSSTRPAVTVNRAHLTVTARGDQQDVVLIVDNREHHGGRRGKSVVECLTKLGCVFEMRPLSVGDYMWIRRDENGQEIALDYVVERKTWHDLSQSIKSGRYQEQKQRLRGSGITGVIVLAEGSEHLGEPRAIQALTNSQMHDGFLVHHVPDSAATARFLHAITMRIAKKQLHSQQEERLLTEVQEQNKKTRVSTVCELWVRQLTVCPGMSVERAHAVAAQFPSLSSLSAFYRECPKELRAGLLHLTIPELPLSLSAQLSAFFARE